MMDEIVILVHGGMVTDVYGSDPSVSVSVLDDDTDDADRMEDIDQEKRELQKRIDDGELVAIL